MRLLALTVICADILCGQIGPEEILLNAKQKILESVKKLPRYMCTETVERDRFATQFRRHLSECDEAKEKPDLKLQTRDRLRLDVAIAPAREIYAWHGAQEFDDRDLLDIVNEGAISTGEFGGHVSNLFGTTIANFTYNGDHTDAQGRTISEFGYSVPKDKSKYLFGNNGHEAFTGYDGTVLIDSATFEVLQIVIHTSSLPAESGACSAKTTLDLQRVPINGFDLLLPGSAHFEIDMLSGDRSQNRVSYSSCREFHAESQVRFDGGEPDAGIAAKPPDKPLGVPPLDIAAGLQFRLKLAEDIDCTVAAAGDTVKLTLASPMKTESSMVVPAGTVVRGRIMRVQRIFAAKPAVFVAIRLETIEAGGKVRPFAGYGELPIQRFNGGVASFTRVRVELGSLDRLENRDTAQLVATNPGEHYIFRAGTEIKWVTMRPGDSGIQK